MMATRVIFRVVSMLCAVCVPMLVHAGSISTVKFLSSGDQAYVEVTAEKNQYRILTESRGDFRAMMVLGDRNNPEVLEFSFIDGSKKIVTIALEFKTAKDVIPPGTAVDNEFIASLSSDADGFKEWQARFSSFSETPTVSRIITDPGFANPIATTIVDSDGMIAARIKDWLCHCRNLEIAADCYISVTRCILDNLCDAWDCIRSGHWTPECEAAIEWLKLCKGDEIEQ